MVAQAKSRPVVSQAHGKTVADGRDGRRLPQATAGRHAQRRTPGEVAAYEKKTATNQKRADGVRLTLLAAAIAADVPRGLAHRPTPRHGACRPLDGACTKSEPMRRA